MLVSHRHKFVFLKTPKTAGTSVEMALQHLCQKDPHAPVSEYTNAIESPVGIVGFRGTPSTRVGPHDAKYFNHMSAALVRDAIGAARWGVYFKIASIRNPFEQAISLFHWRMEKLPRILAESPRLSPRASEEDVRSRFREFVLGLKSNKSIVSVEGRVCLDDVVRAESLEADLRRLGALWGTPDPSPRLPHTKKGTDLRRFAQPADYYDDVTISAVRKHQDWVWWFADYPDMPSTNGWMKEAAVRERPQTSEVIN